MDIKQLNTFLEVARTKSFMRTSENLYLTQPTVSNHVKSIEQELGVHLFVRSKKQ
jgi:DNA-binding transcriptional LysR family regulator